MLGPINESVSPFFLLVWCRKLANVLETSGGLSFLFQRISVLLQRYNSILLHDSFVREDCPE